MPQRVDQTRWPLEASYRSFPVPTQAPMCYLLWVHVNSFWWERNTLSPSLSLNKKTLTGLISIHCIAIRSREHRFCDICICNKAYLIDPSILCIAISQHIWRFFWLCSKTALIGSLLPSTSQSSSLSYRALTKSPEKMAKYWYAN